MTETKTPRWIGPRGEMYVVIQFVIFALIFFGPRKLASWPEWPAPWSTIGVAVGVVLGLIGGALILAGMFNLGHNLTVVPHPKDDSSLVQSGAYALVRHPIYSGIIIGAVGMALWRNGWLTLLYALLLFIFFDIKSRQEERWLTAKFPDYPAYQQRVRKLIPFVY